MPNGPPSRRQSLRLASYDYSQAGAYFITACTQNRRMLFGEVIDSDVRLNEHLIRNEKALDRISAYIANNPARWADDPDNISRAGFGEAGRV